MQKSPSERALPSRARGAVLQGCGLLRGELFKLLLLENYNRTTKEKFEGGEVFKGAAERSRKPFHTAPVNCGFLNKAAVLP